MVAYCGEDWQNEILKQAHKNAFDYLKAVSASRLAGKKVTEGYVLDGFDGRTFSDKPTKQQAFDQMALKQQLEIIEEWAWGRINRAEDMLPELVNSRPSLPKKEE